jgi:hypothetical protein
MNPILSPVSTASYCRSMNAKIPCLN